MLASSSYNEKPACFGQTASDLSCENHISRFDEAAVFGFSSYSEPEKAGERLFRETRDADWLAEIYVALRGV